MVQLDLSLLYPSTYWLYPVLWNLIWLSTLFTATHEFPLNKNFFALSFGPIFNIRLHIISSSEH